MQNKSELGVKLLNKLDNTSWKGPTIREIAEVAGVGPATVDRVLNSRDGVKEKTRQRVLAAYEKLTRESKAGMETLNIRLFCESGETFNAAMASAADQVNRTVPGTAIDCHFVSTSQLDPAEFSRRIAEEGAVADGVILVAREHPAINRAVRRLRSEGIPAICVTTDLPSSRRSAYVGNDQYAAGSVAAQLIGHACNATASKILLVMSVPFRCQQEREMGFRRVLRSEFPHLRIEERVISDDVPETTFEHLVRYFEENGLPDAIYNVAGANRGVADALARSDRAEDTIFVGHELTPISRRLLEAGTMDYVISHDFVGEVAQSVRTIRDFLAGMTTEPAPTQILVHTKHNCGL